MGIISLASGSSCWRGLDYYKEKRVVELNKINENEYLEAVWQAQRMHCRMWDFIIWNPGKPVTDRMEK